MRRAIVGIGNLVYLDQSWCVVYERCGHILQFSRRDLSQLAEADRVVQEYLARCDECGQCCSHAPIEESRAPSPQPQRDAFWDNHRLL